MTLDTAIRLLNLTLTREQIAACRYLERRGKRFMVDFGFENAFEMAFQDMESECLQ